MPLNLPYNKIAEKNTPLEANIFRKLTQNTSFLAKVLKILPKFLKQRFCAKHWALCAQILSPNRQIIRGSGLGLLEHFRKGPHASGQIHPWRSSVFFRRLRRQILTLNTLTFVLYCLFDKKCFKKVLILARNLSRRLRCRIF